MTTLTADPITGRCMKCHQRGSRCTCDGQRCTASHGDDRCELRPHAGTLHQAKHGAHTWLAPTPEAACDCCDGVDGFGIYHFTNPDHLRRWLALPGREEHREITVECVPGEPWALEFVTATDAEAWLEAFDAMERAELAYERRPQGRR